MGAPSRRLAGRGTRGPAPGTGRSDDRGHGRREADRDLLGLREDPHRGAAGAGARPGGAARGAAGKLTDLLPVVRNNVYHPDFRGSFSLKYILTPLVPDLTYSDLVIVDGMLASVEIARLLFVAHKIPPAERDQLRQDLLAYCERDTWATVCLLRRLRELANL